jgi:hypothetical protein
MKYITLIIGLLVVGCGEVENGAYKHRPKQTDTNESTPTTNTNEVDGTTAKPVKELTKEEKKVVGTYEMKEGEDILKLVFLENGVYEFYENGKKDYEDKWSIVDGEIHVFLDKMSYMISVSRINKDNSYSMIAVIIEGKRTDFSKEYQLTYKKIK